MTSPRFARRWLPALVFLALLTGALSSSAQTTGKRVTPKPSPAASPKAGALPAPYVLPATVATVNGEPIKKQDVERVALALLGNSGKTLTDLPTADQKKAYENVLDSIVVDKLASKEATTVNVSDIDVEKRYNDLITQYPTPQEFQDQVKKTGQTTDGIKANIRTQLAQQQWLESQIAADIKVTPEEVEKFYKESPPSKLESPEIVHVRHILIPARKDAPPEESHLAEQKALKLAELIKGGEKFEDIAAKESADKTSGKAGGDLGWFEKDRILPQIGEVAFRLKVNELSAPVRTQFGYHLVQVLDHKSAHTATFDEARDQMKEFLESQKRQKAVAEVVQGLRSKAKIEVFLP